MNRTSGSQTGERVAMDFDEVKDKATDAVEDVKEKVSDVVEDVKDKIGGQADKAKDQASDTTSTDTA
jgi:gas vesicle protein